MYSSVSSTAYVCFIVVVMGVVVCMLRTPSGCYTADLKLGADLLTWQMTVRGNVTHAPLLRDVATHARSS
jgi:hypothetical protein